MSARDITPSAHAYAYADHAAGGVAATARLRLAHRAIDQFIQLTGTTPTPTNPQQTEQAITRMLEVTRELAERQAS